MVVVYCLTRNLYQHIKSNINNILYYYPNAKFYLIIEDDTIEELVNYKNINFININKVDLGIDFSNKNFQTSWTYMTVIRCFLADLIKEDKCLYLDCDTVLLSKIDEIYDIDLKDNYFAGCPFFMGTNYGTAVMVMNLKLMRENFFTLTVIDELNKEFFPLPDEQLLNKICKDKIKPFHRKYCGCEYNGYWFNPSLIHCTPIKQWDERSPYYNLYLKFKEEE